MQVLAGAGLAMCLGSLPSDGLAQSAAGVTVAAPAAASAKKAKPLTEKQRRKNENDAEDAFIAGAKLLERRDVAGAEQEFVRAVTLNPENRDYLRATVAMRESRVTELVQRAGKARILGKDKEADALLEQARAIDPENEILRQHMVPESWKTITDATVDPARSWITDGPRLAGPIELKPTSGVKSFHVRSQLPDMIRQVASAYGIQANFDESVKPVLVRFDLDDVTYEQAMHVALQMGGAFAVPLDATRVMIAKDTPEKRSSLEHLEQETIYLPGLANTQVSEIGNMIRNVFEVKQLNFASGFNTIVLRAPVETIRVLNLTLADLMDGGAQILFDLKIYAIDKSVTRNLGVTVPNQVGAYSVASEANSLVAANQTLVTEAISEGLITSSASNLEIAAALIYYGLATDSLLSGTIAFLGNGISATGLYSSDLATTLNLALSSSDTRALDDIKLRVGDRESATFKVGEKYPITQSTYTTSGTTSSTATIAGVSVASLLAAATTETIPQIQYEDLGLTLKATPTIGRFGQISLHLDLKIESLEGTSVDNIPILNNTSFTSDITLQDGSTATLVSNLSRSQSAAVTGIPGLSDLPGFQSSPDELRTTDESQLVMVLTPHVVRHRREEWASPQIPMAVPASAVE